MVSTRPSPVSLQKRDLSYRTPAGIALRPEESILDFGPLDAASSQPLTVRLNAEKHTSYLLTDPVTGKPIEPKKVRQVQRALEITLADGRVVQLDDFFVELSASDRDAPKYQAQAEFVFRASAAGEGSNWVIDSQAQFLSSEVHLDFVFWRQDCPGQLPMWMPPQDLQALQNLQSFSAGLLCTPMGETPAATQVSGPWGLVGGLLLLGAAAGGGGGSGSASTPAVTSAPVFSSLGTVTVDEGIAAATVVYTAQASTTPAGQALRYTLHGPDAARFLFDTVTGALRFKDVPSADQPADVGADNLYQLVVTAIDASGRSASQVLQIRVRDLPDLAPVFTSADAVVVQENLQPGDAVYQAVARPDVQGAEITYSLALSPSQPDAGLFTLDPLTGELRFKASPDHEAPLDQTDAGASSGDNIYRLLVVATEKNGRSATLAVSITVDDQADVAPTFTSGAGAAVSVSVNENTPVSSVVYRAQAQADLANAVVNYSLVGSDRDRFTLDALTGELRWKAPPDFEAPTSLAGGNRYSLGIVAIDTSSPDLQTTQNVTVDVQDVNDTFAFTSSAAVSVPENSQGTAHTVVARVDSPMASYSYSLGGGADASLFAIDASSGALSFLLPPDFEAPRDHGHDNVYDLTIVAQALGFMPPNGDTISQALQIHVTDVAAATPQAPAPRLQGVSNLDVQSDLVIGFSRPVQLGTDPNVRLRIVHDGGSGFHADADWTAQVAAHQRDFVIAITDTRQLSLAADGLSLRIEPLGDFDFGSRYHLEIDAGAFFDRADPNGASPSAAIASLAAFGTVLPITAAGGAASVRMDASGALLPGPTFIDIEGRGNMVSTDAGLQLASGDFVLVYKDSDPAQGTASTTGIGTGAVGFNLQVAGWGAGDRLYFDDQTVVNAASSNRISAFGGLLDAIAENIPASGAVPNLVGVMQIDPGGVGRPHAWIGFGMHNPSTYDLTGQLSTAVLTA